ncbi:hypothetical protein IJ541_00705 [bacterium]|nr:hypothetical protein [bacterium]
MKRDKFYDIAEKMYVEQFITVVEIANRIGVHERTVRRWKANGNWDEKRSKFYDEITASKDSIYEFSRKMLREIENDIDNKKHVDPSRFYTFLNLVDKLMKKQRLTSKRDKFIKDFIQNFNIDNFQQMF